MNLRARRPLRWYDIVGWCLASAQVACWATIYRQALWDQITTGQISLIEVILTVGVVFAMMFFSLFLMVYLKAIIMLLTFLVAKAGE